MFCSGPRRCCVTGLLFLLYFYRRRLYIRFWILAWTLGAISPLLIAYRFEFVKANNAMYGLSQFVGILSALRLRRQRRRLSHQAADTPALRARAAADR